MCSYKHVFVQLPALITTSQQGVDYLGLDPSRKLLLFSASHPEALRDLKVPLAAVQRHGAVEVRSDLIDHHLYILSRCGLHLLFVYDYPVWLT